MRKKSRTLTKKELKPFMHKNNTLNLSAAADGLKVPFYSIQSQAKELGIKIGKVGWPKGKERPKPDIHVAKLKKHIRTAGTQKGTLNVRKAAEELQSQGIKITHETIRKYAPDHGFKIFRKPQRKTKVKRK